MSRSLRRPVLTNDPASYPNPFLSRQETLKRILLKRIVRHAAEEEVVEQLLRNDPILLRNRSAAPPPPEIFEPLVAFAGIVHYHYDKRVRLNQKLSVLETVVDLIKVTAPPTAKKKLPVDNSRKVLESQKRKAGKTAPEQGSKSERPNHPHEVYLKPTERLDLVLSILPENLVNKSDDLDEWHPFRNKYGFQSAAPTDILGSVRMGQPLKKSAAILRTLRYPTLQSVAHNLPVDASYREMAVHAIRRLEYTRGWTHGQKMQFVNTLKEIANNLASSKLYTKMLDASHPPQRHGFMINSYHRSNHGIRSSQPLLAPLRSRNERIKAVLEKKKRKKR